MLSDQVVLILEELGLEITESIFNYLYDHKKTADDFSHYILLNKEKKSLVRMRFYELKRMAGEYLKTITDKEACTEIKSLQSLSLEDCERNDFLVVKTTSSSVINGLASNVTNVSISNFNSEFISEIQKLIKPSLHITRATVYNRDIWSDSSDKILLALLESKVAEQIVDKIGLVAHFNPTIPVEDIFNNFLVVKYLKKYGEQKYLNTLDVIKEIDFEKIFNPVGYFLTILEK